MWVILSLFYGIAKGSREGIKKKAMQKSSLMEVLFFYTAISFVILIPFSGNVFTVPLNYHLIILFKSFIIFVAWICAFYSLRELPVSLYGIGDSSRIVFSITLAVIFLNESMTVAKIIGMILVICGVFFSSPINFKSEEKIKPVVYVAMFFNCLLNAVSGLLDKIIMSSGEITSGQLQFWFMFYLTLMYGAYILVTKTKVSLKTLKTNYLIVALSVIFVLGDRALFIANSYPESQVTVMTLVKQSSLIVTVLTGALFYHEKHILRRIICAAAVLAGIIIASCI